MLHIRTDTVLRSPAGSEGDITGMRGAQEIDPAKAPRPEPQDFSLTSESFQHGGVIPERLACEKGISPQLTWRNAPAGTHSFVVIMDDPDAKPVVGHTFVHWVAALPAGYHMVEEGVSTGGWTNKHKVLSGGGRASTAYMGPLPPSGTHRYYIAVYAMSSTFADVEFQDLAGSALANDTHTYTRDRFETLFRPDINAKAQIMGTYTAKSQETH